MRLYIGRKEVREYPITQDEYGFSHKNLTYGGVLQRPLDFGSVYPGQKITSDRTFRVLQMKRPPAGSVVAPYAKFQAVGTEYQIIMVHVENLLPVGATILPGETICTIGRAGHIGGWKDANGKFHSYAPHLHIAAQKNGKEYFVRELLFSQADPLYEILMEQRPDVIAAGVPIHLWWQKNGARELRAKLKQAGRQDVLDVAGEDDQWLKQWYIKNGSKEYSEIPYIWGWEAPDPCTKPLAKLTIKFEKKIAALNKTHAEKLAEIEAAHMKAMDAERERTQMALGKYASEKRHHEKLKQDYERLKKEKCPEPPPISEQVVDWFINIFRRGS